MKAKYGLFWLKMTLRTPWLSGGLCAPRQLLSAGSALLAPEHRTWPLDVIWAVGSVEML